MLRNRLWRFLLLGALMVCASGFSSYAQTAPRSDSPAAWHFAVSGDSRNCGDIIMPEIAAQAKRDGAAFYWHLGDLRWIAEIDQDFRQLAHSRWREFGYPYYERHAWDDFLENQVKPFGTVPFYLGIGNHDTTFPKSRAKFVGKFSGLLDTPELRAQRVKDNPQDTQVRTYYHWTRDGVDFINLDNATPDQLDATQLAWFEARIAQDATSREISTVVVGMHAALPESISAGHSMNEWETGVVSGRRVYEDLLTFQNRNHKSVYVLASHSHYFMDGIFNTEYWRTHGGVLPGWIVGTAGARHYPLPPRARDANSALADTYGYLLATVNPPGKPRGTVSFEFKQINKMDVPDPIVSRFTRSLVDQCFDDNGR